MRRERPSLWRGGGTQCQRERERERGVRQERAESEGLR
jgi:hypothetical protein